MALILASSAGVRILWVERVTTRKKFSLDIAEVNFSCSKSIMGEKIQEVLYETRYHAKGSLSSNSPPLQQDASAKGGLLSLLSVQGVKRLKEKWDEPKNPKRLMKWMSLFVSSGGEYVAVASGNKITILRKDDDYKEPCDIFIGVIGETDTFYIIRSSGEELSRITKKQFDGQQSCFFSVLISGGMLHSVDVRQDQTQFSQEIPCLDYHPDSKLLVVVGCPDDVNPRDIFDPGLVFCSPRFEGLFSTVKGHIDPLTNPNYIAVLDITDKMDVFNLVEEQYALSVITFDGSRDCINGIADFTWWSDSILILMKLTGVVTMLDILNGAKFMDSDPIFSMRVLVRVQQCQGCVFVLESLSCEERDSHASHVKREILEMEDKRKGKGSEDRFNQLDICLLSWNLISFCERYVSAMYSSSISNQQYQVAMQFANCRGPDKDEILKSQWLLSDRGANEMNRFLSNIKDQEFILSERLEKVGPTEESAKALISKELCITDKYKFWNRKKTNQGRLHLLLYRDRLKTFVRMNMGRFSILEYSKFQITPLIEVAVTLAASGKIGASNLLFKHHPYSLAPFMLESLAVIPETIPSHNQNGTHSAEKRRIPSVDELSSWYRTRARDIDISSGQLDNSVCLVEFSCHKGIMELQHTMRRPQLKEYKVHKRLHEKAIPFMQSRSPPVEARQTESFLGRWLREIAADNKLDICLTVVENGCGDFEINSIFVDAVKAVECAFQCIYLYKQTAKGHVAAGRLLAYYPFFLESQSDEKGVKQILRLVLSKFARRQPEKAFPFLDLEYMLICRGLLKAGKFSPARNYLKGTSTVCLATEKDEKLVIQAAREYFYSASSLACAEIWKAKECLNIFPNSRNVKAEADIVDALTVKLLNLGVTVLPVEFRQIKNPVGIINKVITTQTGAYGIVDELIEIVNLLGSHSQEDIAAVQEAVAKKAAVAGDLQLAFDLCLILAKKGIGLSPFLDNMDSSSHKQILGFSLCLYLDMQSQCETLAKLSGTTLSNVSIEGSLVLSLPVYSNQDIASITDCSAEAENDDDQEIYLLDAKNVLSTIAKDLSLSRKEEYGKKTACEPKSGVRRRYTTVRHNSAVTEDEDLLGCSILLNLVDAILGVEVIDGQLKSRKAYQEICSIMNIGMSYGSLNSFGTNLANPAKRRDLLLCTFQEKHSQLSPGDIGISLSALVSEVWSNSEIISEISDQKREILSCAPAVISTISSDVYPAVDGCNEQRLSYIFSILSECYSHLKEAEEPLVDIWSASDPTNMFHIQRISFIKSGNFKNITVLGGLNASYFNEEVYSNIDENTVEALAELVRNLVGIFPDSEHKGLISRKSVYRHYVLTLLPSFMTDFSADIDILSPESFHGFLSELEQNHSCIRNYVRAMSLEDVLDIMQQYRMSSLPVNFSSQSLPGGDSEWLDCLISLLKFWISLANDVHDTISYDSFEGKLVKLNAETLSQCLKVFIELLMEDKIFVDQGWNSISNYARHVLGGFPGEARRLCKSMVISGCGFESISLVFSEAKGHYLTNLDLDLEVRRSVDDALDLPHLYVNILDSMLLDLVSESRDRQNWHHLLSTLSRLEVIFWEKLGMFSDSMQLQSHLRVYALGVMQSITGRNLVSNIEPWEGWDESWCSVTGHETSDQTASNHPDSANRFTSNLVALKSTGHAAKISPSIKILPDDLLSEVAITEAHPEALQHILEDWEGLFFRERIEIEDVEEKKLSGDEWDEAWESFKEQPVLKIDENEEALSVHPLHTCWMEIMKKFLSYNPFADILKVIDRSLSKSNVILLDEGEAQSLTQLVLRIDCVIALKLCLDEVDARLTQGPLSETGADFELLSLFLSSGTISTIASNPRCSATFSHVCYSAGHFSYLCQEIQLSELKSRERQRSKSEEKDLIFFQNSSLSINRFLRDSLFNQFIHTDTIISLINVEASLMKYLEGHMRMLDGICRYLGNTILGLRSSMGSLIQSGFILHLSLDVQ
ncbi:hypothetical protein MKX01_004584 [Papaver californicum]|nr:hypothetical protein MKX01_004584 [Papaver californicum]